MANSLTSDITLTSESATESSHTGEIVFPAVARRYRITLAQARRMAMRAAERAEKREADAFKRESELWQAS